ncbi:hypothetical protein EC988_001124 [Linderina pennispora]|nr:hypothetical protein EC988_001124 [Linderina pennispora]
MVASVAISHPVAADPVQQHEQQQELNSRPSKMVVREGIHTGRSFDELSPDERDTYLADIELDFRKYIGDNRPKGGFVFYPNSRQIMKAISTLYQTLAAIDFSDIFE